MCERTLTSRLVCFIVSKQLISASIIFFQNMKPFGVFGDVNPISQSTIQNKYEYLLNWRPIWFIKKL